MTHFMLSALHGKRDMRRGKRAKPHGKRAASRGKRDMPCRKRALRRGKRDTSCSMFAEKLGKRALRRRKRAGPRLIAPPFPFAVFSSFRRLARCGHIRHCYLNILQLIKFRGKLIRK